MTDCLVDNNNNNNNKWFNDSDQSIQIHCTDHYSLFLPAQAGQ